jgi:hypothetical protein
VPPNSSTLSRINAGGVSAAAVTAHPHPDDGNR